MRVVIASGSGRYGDPWHPFARTSSLLAEVLAAAGFVVDIDHDVDHALAHLEGYQLLVVNAGDPWRGDQIADRPPAEAVHGFAGAIERGIGVLGIHASVSSLRDYPEWAPAIGAIWIPGGSSHPPSDRATIRVDSAFPGGAAGDFDVVDERYCDLQHIGRSQIVARHQRDGDVFPTAWIRELATARVACDLLGHDEQSYESAGHRALVTGLALWATRQPSPGVERRSTG